MTSTLDWPGARPLTSERLALEPLRVDHAEEMAPLLDDTELHSFIGGHPATVEQLRDRYARQIVGRSPDGSQRWLNWVVRERESGEALGTVQATIAKQDGKAVAEVAWVIGSPHQRRGFAREAATAMAAWLRQPGYGSRASTLSSPTFIRSTRPRWPSPERSG